MPSLLIPGRGVVDVTQPRVVLLGESGTRFSVPFAPTMEKDGYAPNFSTQERIGRKPVFAQASKSLQVHTLQLIVAGRDPATNGLDYQVSVENELAVLTKIAQSGERVQWSGYGPSVMGVFFRISALKVTELTLQAGTNQVTRAQVDMTLTEASDSIAHLGPVTGGVSPPPGTPPGAIVQAAASAPASAAPAASGAAQSYVVRSGDTLSKIAIQFYRDAGKYKRIADANGIKNPSAIRVGQKLTIPA